MILGWPKLAFFLEIVKAALDEKYTATCNFYIGTDNYNMIEQCDSAIFSAERNYDLAGPVVFVDADFCRNGTVQSTSKHAIAVVSRGNCSFDIKASVAYFSSYQGLIIVNSDLEVFPMGGASYEHQVPAVMVDSAFLRYKGRSTTMYGRIQFGKSLNRVFAPLCYAEKHRDVVTPAKLSSTLLYISLGALLLSLQYPSCAYIAIPLIALLLRLPTLRQYANEHGALSPNHRETDELIFQDLIYLVTHSSDYSLQHSPLLPHLSAANYNHAIFLHPPNYVYLTSFLAKYISVSCCNVMYHILSILLIPCLVHSFYYLYFMAKHKEIYEWKNLFRNTECRAVAIWAMLLLQCCPIAFLCSQKIWLDNLLMLSIEIALVVHVYCVSCSLSATTEKYAIYHVISGAIFGACAMNTKITAAALLPTLMLITIFVTEAVHDHQYVRSIIGVAALVAGMLCTHLPWIVLYKVYSGHWLPTSVPSAEMIASSTYMTRSFSQSTLFYLQELFIYSPLHLVGAGILLSCAAPTVIPFARRLYDWYKTGTPVGLSCQISWNKLFLLGVTYPVAYIGAMTLLGNTVSGYQLRFLLPILPITAVISAFIIVQRALSLPIIAMLLVYGTLYIVYYGVLFAPFYADFEANIIDIIRNMLDHPYQSSLSRVNIAEILEFMHHFGIAREV